MKKSKLIKISLIISVLCLNIFGDWTSGGGSGQKVFTKPINFWNAIVTTTTTQQTSMNAVFPFSREIQAMNAIFETDSEYKNAVRIRLDKNSLTNLANFATTNIAVQLNTIMDNLYFTGIWSVATATNSSKGYVDILVSSETASRIAGDLSGSNNVSGLISTEESARIATDALKYDKAGGSIGGDVIVTGMITSIINDYHKTILNPASIEIIGYGGYGVELTLGDNTHGDQWFNFDDQIRCTAPSDDTEVALLSTVKTFTNNAFNTVKTYIPTLSYETKTVTNGLATINYADTKLSKSGGIITGNLTISNNCDIRLSTDSMLRDYLDYARIRFKDYTGYAHLSLETYNPYGYKGNIILDSCGDILIAASDMNTPTSVVDKAYVDTANNNVLDDAKTYADSVAIDLTTVSNQFLLRTGDYVGGTMTFSNDINLAASGVTTIRNTYPGFSGITIIAGNNPSPGDLKLKTDNIPYSDAGDIVITAGNSTDTLGNGDGGSISLSAGSANGSGTAGDIYIASSAMNSPTSVVTKSYVDAATNAVQTVQESIVINISDYVSLNNISNYIYKLTADNTTVSGKTQTWVTAKIELKDLNDNIAPDFNRCYNVILTKDISDAVALAKGELITIINNKSYKVISDSPTSTFDISLKNNDDPDTEYMYITYGQSTIKITFNFTQ